MKEFIDFWKSFWKMLCITFYGADSNSVPADKMKKPIKHHLTPEQAKAIAARYLELKAMKKLTGKVLYTNNEITKTLNSEFGIERTQGTYATIAKKHKEVTNETT